MQGYGAQQVLLACSRISGCEVCLLCLAESFQAKLLIVTMAICTLHFLFQASRYELCMVLHSLCFKAAQATQLSLQVVQGL